MPVVDRVKQELEAFRVKVDDRTEVTPGFKFNDWEMRGVPVRIEIGPKDVEKGSVAIARRDIPGRDGKQFVSQQGLTETIDNLLKAIQQNLLQKATAFRDANIHDTTDYEELKKVVEGGWAYSWWCGSAECEAKVKEDTKATTRCMPLDQPEGEGKCVVCGQKAEKKVYFAKAY
jgi:prolyl-tRNA synthetase